MAIVAIVIRGRTLSACGPVPCGMGTSYDVGCTSRLSATGIGPLAVAGGGILPGSSCRDSSPTTKGLPFGSKRAIKLISFWSPPTSSHGSHTL